jgi:hypothetical protein
LYWRVERSGWDLRSHQRRKDARFDVEREIGGLPAAQG